MDPQPIRTSRCTQADDMTTEADFYGHAKILQIHPTRRGTPRTDHRSRPRYLRRCLAVSVLFGRADRTPRRRQRGCHTPANAPAVGGYTPMVSLPKRWFSTTASVRGRNLRVFWSTFFRSSGRLLLIAFQSFTTAGIYPRPLLSGTLFLQEG